jgi:hypothetical protein
MVLFCSKYLPGTGRWIAEGETEGSGVFRKGRHLRRGPDPSTPSGHLPVPGRKIQIIRNIL